MPSSALKTFKPRLLTPFKAACRPLFCFCKISEPNAPARPKSSGGANFLSRYTKKLSTQAAF